MGLAIVAIPEQGDRSYKVSSEKVPHCTLLFLGDAATANVAKIAEFLEHAVSTSEIGPFGLEVDYRGTLGPDNADVLFFQKRWSGKRLAEFRGQLLQDRNIRDAYDSAPQFGSPDEWTPHLTLGYPRAPARKDDQDWPIRWVEFDRIALWTGDYSGPEFRLEHNYNDDIGELAMSAEADRGREFLEHYGVKGMKWGQRNASRSSDGTVTATPKTGQGIRGNKTKVKAEGGENHPAHEDAIKIAAKKQVLKKSGPAALSNKDLQDVITRANLEKQAQQVTANAGKKFVTNKLGQAGNQQVQGVVNRKASEFVDNVTKKKN